jgi:hypothetical protein
MRDYMGDTYIAIVTTPIYALKGVILLALFVRKQDEPKCSSANYHQEMLS